MKKINFKSWFPHIIAILIFLLLTIIYFSPYFFDGKDLAPHDVLNFNGMGKDLRDYHEETGEYAFWSNAMFGGMPSNQTYQPSGINIFKYLSISARFGIYSLHAGILFFYLIGFYIFLISIGCKPWLSIVGAIGYAFVSYNLIIIEAGHINKAFAMATMAPILGGVMLCYRQNYFWGALITLIFAGINIFHAHIQISYYLILILAFLVIVYLIYAIKEKTIKSFLKSSLLLVIIAFIAFLPSVGRLIPMQDYSKDSIRGGSVLQNTEGEKNHSGLDLTYAFQWSYGKAETMTLLIPDFYGGSSNYNIGTNSETYKTLVNAGQKRQFAQQFCKQAPAYWGDQPFTSGPVYGGAIICFLFVLGLLVVKGKEKWWLLAATIFSILLSWGSNLMWFNEFLFKYLPLYNKFRAPSMALVIANVTMVTLGILAIKEIIENKSLDKKKLLKQLYISGGITGGLCLIFALFGGALFSFSAASDSNYPDWLISALHADRKHLLVTDSLRSFFFIAMAFLGILFYIKKGFKTNYLILGFGILILIDLWAVDKRFLNDDDFIDKKKAKEFEMTEANKTILQDKDPDFRVFNLTVSSFNDASTSYFHKSIGGYSGAKLRRYQDIIDHHFSKGINMNVVNMLNTKYFIVPDKNQNNKPITQRNYQALGNAWFVDSIRWVNSPDEEIVALNNFDPAKTAIIDKKWESKLSNSEALIDTSNNATIKLTDYANPGYLIYESKNSKTQLAVFSEIFYKTWKVYIDGEQVPLIQVNYILRGLEIPAGDHTIEFKCVDELFAKCAKISLWSSIFVGIIILGLFGAIIYQTNNKNKTIKA